MLSPDLSEGGDPNRLPANPVPDPVPADGPAPSGGEKNDLESALMPSRDGFVLKPDSHYHVEAYPHFPDLQTIRSIAPLFQKAYGDRYRLPAFEDPQSFLDELKCGKTIAVMLRDPAGQIVAHGAIMKLGDKVVELGRLVVEPNLRGQHFGRLLRDESFRIVRDMHSRGEADVVIIEGLTSHTISQKMFAELGWKTTGIFDRKYPEWVKEGERETVLRMNWILDDGIKKERAVYIPASLAEIARNIYSQNGCARSLMEPEAALSPLGGCLVADRSELAPFGALTLNADPGCPVGYLVDEALRHLADGAAHVSVRIRLDDPRAILQASALQRAGFYFAALEMHPSSDYLVLQKPRDVPFPHIKKLLSEESMTLLEQARKTRY